jgi:2-polyprenyl-6-methoxyphenol hydroxylase-like FAD-dependent oxidoreductase
MRAIIVGAGVAGPVTALALQQAGIDAVVHERHGRPNAEVGAWFSVAPNGLDALDAVGVLHLAQQIGIPTHTNVMRGATGRELGRISLGQPLADGTPALTMKRSHLAAVLAEECERRGIEVRYGSTVTHAESRGSRAVVTFADGTTDEAELLIGADGVHSVVRPMIDPSAPTGRYVGLTNFGGMTRGAAAGLASEQLEPGTWQFVFGRRAFFGHHATPAGDVVWFVNEPSKPITADERLARDEAGWRDHLAGLFADDAGPAADLIRRGYLELTGDNTHDLGHVPAWHRGSMIVIGDAAHAPAPSSGQGASMSMEDGVVLAQALRDCPDVTTAFVAYESVRRARVERIVKVGARSSSAKTPGRLTRPFQEALMRLVFRYAVTDRSMAWMYDHRIDWETPMLNRAPVSTR